jgi:hypothetical protein
MQISMTREDNVVNVAGKGRYVDMATMSTNIHAVQYNTESKQGWIEYSELPNNEKEWNKPIDEAYFNNNFQKYVDVWSLGGDEPVADIPDPSTPTELVNNAYNESRVFAAIVDYLADKGGQSSSSVLSDITNKVRLG